MVRNKAIFCLKAVIYKCLQLLHHNYAISRNKYLVFTLAESTTPHLHPLQFLFKSTHYSG